MNAKELEQAQISLNKKVIDMAEDCMPSNDKRTLVISQSWSVNTK